VELDVTDPDGFTITAQTVAISERELLREIPGVWYYSEAELDDDGHSSPVVTAPVVKPGAYLIRVMPKPGATPSDKYSLEVQMGSNTVALAGDTFVSDIPPLGYGIESEGGSVVPFLPVSIDIKPGGFPNAINLGSPGVTPVAILSTPGFDATTTELATVRLAGAAPVRSTIADVDSDGDPDLLAFFQTRELRLSMTDTQAVLTAQTTSSRRIRGVDSVKLVPFEVRIKSTGGRVELSIPSESGKRYQAQFKNDLNEPIWTDLGPAAVASGASTVIGDDNAARLQRFYRILELP
jgi:hypothetical protein